MTSLVPPPGNPSPNDIAAPAEVQPVAPPTGAASAGKGEWLAAFLVHPRATLKDLILSGRFPRPVLFLLLPAIPLALLVALFGPTTVHAFLLRYASRLLGLLVLLMLLAGLLIWVMKRLKTQTSVLFTDLVAFHHLLYLAAVPAILLAVFTFLPTSAIPAAASRVVLIYPNAEQHHEYPPGIYSSIETVVKELTYDFPHLKLLKYEPDDDLAARLTQELYASTFSILITAAGLSPAEIWSKLPPAERDTITIIGTDPFNGSETKPSNWLYCSQGIDQEIEALKPIFQEETADHRVAILRDSTEPSKYAARAISALLEPLPVPHHWTRTITADDPSALLGDLVSDSYGHRDGEYLVITASHPWVHDYLAYLRAKAYRGTVVLLSPASLFLTSTNAPAKLLLTGPRQLYSAGQSNQAAVGLPPLHIENVLTASLRSAADVAEHLRTDVQQVRAEEIRLPVPTHDQVGDTKIDLGRFDFTRTGKAVVAAEVVRVVTEMNTQGAPR